MALWQDIRYAIRLLIQDRWFTTVAAVALALGIGANAAVFTFVNAVLLRGLPFDDPDRIISIGSLDARPQSACRVSTSTTTGSGPLANPTMPMGAGVNVADEGNLRSYPAELVSAATRL
jgi:hypothetical protein